jgi:hypothetical protein
MTEIIVALRNLTEEPNNGQKNLYLYGALFYFKTLQTLGWPRTWQPFVGHKALLGAFAKLGKAIIIFTVRVCPFACMEQLGAHWTNFR